MKLGVKEGRDVACTGVHGMPLSLSLSVCGAGGRSTTFTKAEIPLPSLPVSLVVRLRLGASGGACSKRGPGRMQTGGRDQCPVELRI